MVPVTISTVMATFLTVRRRQLLLGGELYHVSPCNMTTQKSLLCGNGQETSVSMLTSARLRLLVISPFLSLPAAPMAVVTLISHSLKATCHAGTE